MNKNIHTLTLLSLLVLSITSVIALDLDQDVVEEIATQEDFVIAGVTPDEFLYRFELFFEGFSEAFSEDAKIEHMKERVSEAKVMTYENKFDYSIKAIGEFNKINNRLKNKTMLMEHSQFMGNLGQKVSTIARQGNMTDLDIDSIKELIQSHQEGLKKESINIISKRTGTTQAQASMLFDREQEQVRNRITVKINQRIQKVEVNRMQDSGNGNGN